MDKEEMLLISLVAVFFILVIVSFYSSELFSAPTQEVTKCFWVEDINNVEHYICDEN